MNNQTYTQLSEAIRALIPDFPPSEENRLTGAENIEQFFETADAQTKELAETAELLMKLERQDGCYESG